ncbi:MAG TPA: cytochrome c oxidase accessory protein CcoG [Bacteroidia bacterium]|nr:cytochrome c oxidase accessory protein CcoG [Bacteroidia bacterium]
MTEEGITVDKKNQEAAQDESFRDSIATINKAGRRNYIFPKKPHGRLYNLRTITSLVYLAVFFTLPFIKIGGDPLFMFNVVERKFILFGQIFWPQDFVLFGLGMITFIVFIVLFTVVFGRVFCGWACPQTIFMEMVFRKIEYLIDGDATEQRRLDQLPWNSYKIRKRALKWGIFYVISFIIANFFLAYIIGMDGLLKIIREPLSMHVGGFISLIIFSFVFFGVFAWFREQACLIVCPYGRLQGVMLDRNSIVVAYDHVRGEPRGHLHKNEKRDLGDCVDCSLCVKVCPTGIDIRNGTQLECVNCTACIDACDEVMEKVHKPKGLIRYASESSIADKKQLRFTPRIKAYTFLLLLLVGVEVFLLAGRSDVDATILRAGGQLFQEQPGDKISNLYTVRVINKTRNDYPITFRLESGDGEIQMVGKPLMVQKEGKGETEFFILRDKTDIHSRKTKIRIGVYSGDKKLESVSTNFLGPVYVPGEDHHEEEEKNDHHD